MILLYLVLGLLTLAVCLGAGPLGRWFRLMDVPDGARKTHSEPTPLVGGLAIMVSVVAMSLILAATTDLGPFYGVLALASVAFLALGLIDDRRHIGPSWRLALSFAGCFAVLALVPAFEVSFLRFSFLPITLFLDGWAAPVFTLVCLVGLQNAVNMADGRNGLVISLSLLWTLLLFGYAPAHLYPLLAIFAVGLAIVLAFNLSGRLFLGDSGTYSLSVVVGLLAIYSYQVNFTRMTADAVALLFLIPVADCLRLVVLRIADGRSPFSSDNNHLHHLLERVMPWERALPVYIALVAVPNLLAIAWPGRTLAWGLLALLAYGAAVAIGHRLAMEPRHSPA